jgi:hypothetical protein
MEERLEMRKTKTKLLRDCPICGGQISVPTEDCVFVCSECSTALVMEVKVFVKEEGMTFCGKTYSHAETFSIEATCRAEAIDMLQGKGITK